MKNWSQKIAVGAVALTALTFAPLVSAQYAATNVQAKTPAASTQAKVYQFLKSMKVTAVSGSTITAVGEDGTTYTVNASKAVIVRRYNGKSSLSEVAVDDMIWVKGTVTTKGATDVTAKKVHNMSVQERGAVEGIVQSVSSTGFTLSAYGEMTYTVTVNAKTVYRNNTKTPFKALSDVTVGDKVRVSGVRDKATKMDAADAVRLLKAAPAPQTPAPTPTPVVPSAQQ